MLKPKSNHVTFLKPYRDSLAHSVQNPKSLLWPTRPTMICHPLLPSSVDLLFTPALLTLFLSLEHTRHTPAAGHLELPSVWNALPPEICQLGASPSNVSFSVRPSLTTQCTFRPHAHPSISYFPSFFVFLHRTYHRQTYYPNCEFSIP